MAHWNRDSLRATRDLGNLDSLVLPFQLILAAVWGRGSSWGGEQFPGKVMFCRAPEHSRNTAEFGEILFRLLPGDHNFPPHTKKNHTLLTHCGFTSDQTTPWVTNSCNAFFPIITSPLLVHKLFEKVDWKKVCPLENLRETDDQNGPVSYFDFFPALKLWTMPPPRPSSPKGLLFPSFLHIICVPQPPPATSFSLLLSQPPPRLLPIFP